MVGARSQHSPGRGPAGVGLTAHSVGAWAEGADDQGDATAIGVPLVANSFTPGSQWRVNAVLLDGFFESAAERVAISERGRPRDTRPPAPDAWSTLSDTL